MNEGKGFFSIDRRCWHAACSAGLNEATAYVCIATGTGKTQAQTAWSAHAIEKHTGMSRPNAKAAIARLVELGLIRVIRAGTRPRYEIVSWYAREIEPGLSAKERAFLDAIAEVIHAGDGDTSKVEEGAPKIAAALLKRGGIIRDEFGYLEKAPPIWIWLPNTLVLGAGHEASPVARVRSTQDALTMRLLVDLYYVHDLPGQGGVDRAVFQQLYERENLGERGEFVIWGFAADDLQTRWNVTTSPHRCDGEQPGRELFARFQTLRDLRLMEMVPHLVESDDPHAEIITPLDDLCGRNIGDAAVDAVSRIAAEYQQAKIDRRGDYSYLVPVHRHLAKVQVVGIPRLVYRPHTAKTAAWWADLLENGPKMADFYDGIFIGNPQKTTTMQHQR